MSPIGTFETMPLTGMRVRYGAVHLLAIGTSAELEWDAERVRTRMLAIAAVVSLLVTGWLSLLPFDDREVRCGPPLFGADPPANYSITPGTCSDAASDRLLLAALFLTLAITLAAAAIVARSKDRSGRRRKA